MNYNFPRPMTLIVLDGFGYREESEHNAIAQAHMPFWHYLKQSYPHTLIKSSGVEVGLPPGQMGNSEVGHLNIGAGRIVYQDLTRIDTAIANGDFFTNPVLLKTIQAAVQANKAIHILGLISPGGVHSHELHVHALIELAYQQKAAKVYLHSFLDGRDTPPKSALNSLHKLELLCENYPQTKMASLIGRYYAMDRDKRWDRINKAYDLIISGQADFHAPSAELALLNAYDRNETDEFVQATTIHDEHANPVSVEDGDVIIFMNFRADRARQLTESIITNNFHAFHRKRVPQLTSFVCLAEYDASYPIAVAFPPEPMQQLFGEYISQLGLKQLRIAETEKYAHVTFFFNGGIETPFPGEDRLLIPSPKIATYDTEPEMSAILVTNKLVSAIQSQQYDVIICNFANPDMLGHTGNFPATVKAMEVIDHCLQRTVTAAQSVGGEVLITADHGNAETMFDPLTQQAHTAHTSNPVPFLYVGRKAMVLNNQGKLSDVIPSLLNLMNLKIPEAMTGTPLFKLTEALKINV